MNKKAFSLIEVMIILVIASVGILATIPLMTGKNYTAPHWISQTTSGNISYVSFGQDERSNDRVGIMIDPYLVEGKLSVGTMGVMDNGTNYPKFIFGGVEDPAGTFTFDDNPMWIRNNTNSTLIIGRNYPDVTLAGVGVGGAAGYNLGSSTIVSSFPLPRPAQAIQGTCIGNVTLVDACDSDIVNEYNLNDVVLINNTSTSFRDPTNVANNIIVVNNTPEVTINANAGLNITGDIYALGYDFQLADVADAGYVVCQGSTAAVAGVAPIEYYNCVTAPAVNCATANVYADTISAPATPIVPAGKDTNVSFAAGDKIPADCTSDYVPALAPDHNAEPDADPDHLDIPNDQAESDIRLKNVLKPYEKGLDYISKIKTHYYTFKNDAQKKLHAGIIAQEIIGIFDEALEKTKDGFYSYKKSPFLYAMVNSVKSLYSEQQSILKEQEELLKMVKNG